MVGDVGQHWLDFGPLPVDIPTVNARIHGHREIIVGAVRSVLQMRRPGARQNGGIFSAEMKPHTLRFGVSVPEQGPGKFLERRPHQIWTDEGQICAGETMITPEHVLSNVV